MDGGARLSSDVSEIKIAFGIPPERPTPNFAASWNVAPTDPLPVVRYDGKDRQRSLEVMRWGLIPYWAKDDKIGFSTINARGRGGRHQAGVPRAVPPAPLPGAGREFLRMEKSAKGKQPYAVGLEDGGLMALAGLWDTWHSPAGERIRSFTIITTPPNDLGAELHNRMPAVLKPETWPLWLGEQPAELAQVKALLAPYPSDGMICWPVSPRVGSVKNNDPSLVEPIVLS